jgi:hypothetical protein
MTILEDTMKQIIETDKEIIERLTTELVEANERITELENVNNTLLIRLDLYEQRNEELLFKLQSYENAQHCQCCNCINKNYSINNNDIENSDTYINLKKDYNIILDKNKEMESQIKELSIKVNNLPKNDINEDISSKDKTLIDNKIQDALNKQKIIFEKEIEKRDDEYNTLYDNFNKLDKDFQSLKNNQGILTPSNSNEIKKDKKKSKNNDENIELHDNIYEIVYYRHINLLPSYFIDKEKSFLNCCKKDWRYKELNKENGVTCMKCYKTYKLNDNNKLINEILSNHIINNEKEILNKIKCNNNNCNYISKKEIELCNSCKYVDGCKPIVTDLPKDNVGIRTIKTFASETFTQLHFYDKVYNTAKEEKINVYEMKPLVEFIKNNKLMKEKQPNIIIKKILRSRYILDIYNEDKYKNIQDVIKRIYINLDYIPKLDDYQFNYFKDILINMLDAEIKKK